MSISALNAPINILFILNSVDVGGAEMQTITLMNGLDPQRFRLSLAYLKDEDDLLSKIDRDRINGSIFCCHVTSKIDWRAARTLAATICKESIDIVVCANTYPLLYGWLARRLSGRALRIVEVFHTTELATFKDWCQMGLYRPLLLMSDMLVYVCENQRRYWRSRLLASRQEVVIHNGIDTDHFANRYSEAEIVNFRTLYRFSSTDYVVGLCANMRPEKAHGDLLEAIAHLRNGGVRIKCLLIGDGPERSAIETKIGQMDLGTDVSITGLIADVRPAIAACDVIVIASHRVETFSIAALESMALGKPMIMTNIGGASEQVVHADNGYLYERGNIAALTDSLLRLTDRSHCKQLGQNARLTVTEKFSLTAMIDAYERLFVGLMSSAVLAGDGKNVS